MDATAVVDILASLAQPTRLEVFRLLATAEPEGLPAGDIARTLGVPHNTLSNHLTVLTRAELVRGERRSRSIIYRVSFDGLSQALTYLVKDCCGGHPEMCIPLLPGLAPCCKPERKHRSRRKAAHERL